MAQTEIIDVARLEETETEHLIQGLVDLTKTLEQQHEQLAKEHRALTKRNRELLAERKELRQRWEQFIANHPELVDEL